MHKNYLEVEVLQYNYSANMYGGDDPELGFTIFLEVSNLKTAKIRVHKNFLEVVRSLVAYICWRWMKKLWRCKQ